MASGDKLKSERFEKMKRHYWKILGVLILAYTFVAGLLVPLKPGILEIKPQSIRSGTNVAFQVMGYNTQYLTAKNRA